MARTVALRHPAGSLVPVEHVEQPAHQPDPSALGTPAPPTPSRRTLVLLVAPLVVLTIIGTVGNALLPTLLRENPLLLLMTDARNRQLILVSNLVDPVPFFVVGVLRRMLSDPLYYLLGLLYGDRAVRWIERRMGDDAGMVRGLERLFAKVAPLLVFLFPGQLICVLAGATRMNPWLFGVLNVVGTLTVVGLLRQFGDVFQGPVGGVTDFITRNYLVLTVVSVLLTALWLMDQRRRGRGELTALTKVDEDLEA